jgi:hypothetical protein
MSKSLLLLALTIPVFAEGVDSPDTNNSKTNYELLVFGKSKHFCENRNGHDFNEVNPGIGFSMYQRKTDSALSTSYTAAVYQNSYFRWTGIVGYGWHYNIGDFNKFHTVMGIHVGVVANCEIIWPVAIPYIGVGYKNFSLYCTELGLGAFGLYAGYRF